MTVDLKALKRLYAAATKGPWVVYHEHRTLEIQDGKGTHSRNAVVHWTGFDSSSKEWGETVSNAELIVALVNAFPALLSELRALREDAATVRHARRVRG